MVVAGCSAIAPCEAGVCYGTEQVEVGAIVGADYIVHVDRDAARKCNEAWALFPNKAPVLTYGCAIWRQGAAGDLQVGEIFLPAAMNCVALAPPYRWMVAHEVRRCAQQWHD